MAAVSKSGAEGYIFQQHSASRFQLASDVIVGELFSPLVITDTGDHDCWATIFGKSLSGEDYKGSESSLYSYSL